MVLDKKSQMIHSSNLGDSGFLVIRRGSVVHQSSEQQHYFNTPYQLAIPPPGQAGAVIQDRFVLTFLCTVRTENDCLFIYQVLWI